MCFCSQELAGHNEFGGRIPILRPDVMSDPQKQVYDRILAGTVPWATNAGFRVKAEGGGLLGPYNSQLLSPGTDAGYLDMLDAEKKQTMLSKRVREVIILSEHVGAGKTGPNSRPGSPNWDRRLSCARRTR
jgi:hypothetical protein